MQLQAQPELAAKHRMVDDASGDVKVRVAYANPLVTNSVVMSAVLIV